MSAAQLGQLGQRTPHTVHGVELGTVIHQRLVVLVHQLAVGMGIVFLQRDLTRHHVDFLVPGTEQRAHLVSGCFHRLHEHALDCRVGVPLPAVPQRL